MKTSVIESPGRIVIKDTALPEIVGNDVLVKLQGTGLCSSNLPAWEGCVLFHYPFEPGAPEEAIFIPGLKALITY